MSPRIYCIKPSFSDVGVLHEEPRLATNTLAAKVRDVDITLPMCDECFAKSTEPMKAVVGSYSIGTATTAIQHAPHCHATVPSPDRPDGGCICGAWKKWS